MKNLETKIKQNPKNTNSLFYSFAVVTVAFIAISSLCVGTANARTYTTDADFDEGVLVGVEHETVHDQLQLSKRAVTLPFIWVPNNNGTVSKVSTETGNELGRYMVAPHPDCSPSRTTVDLDGSCWVGNRQAGTVVKIGLYEAGMWIDRNGDGICQTSQDLDHDGNISGSEILPWGQDECVLYEVVLITGMEGTYAPGTYPGAYDHDYWGTAPRGLAIDANNNLWAGTSKTQKYYYIDGSTGIILRTIDVSPWGHCAYGAVIDRYGVIWSSGNPGPDIYLDTRTDPPTISTWTADHFVYGVGLDYLDHLFGTGWCDNVFSKFDISSPPSPPPVKEWTKPTTQSCSRGIVATNDNNIWIANSSSNTVTRYDNDGNLLATIPVGSQPTGVAVDAAGKVWTCNIGDEYISRIDPNTNAVDLSKQIIGSGGHYTYSDMTGIISRTITTKIGTWTVIYDSGVQNTPWTTVSWTSDEPNGTSVTVKVRSSNDGNNWSEWENATNGEMLSETPGGQYIQIESTLQIISGDISPVLYDLTVESRDITPPVIICPEDETIECPADPNLVSSGSVSVSDNSCGPITVTYSGSSAGTCPMIITRTWTATDESGNSSSCTQLITVQDTTPPEVSCSATVLKSCKACEDMWKEKTRWRKRCPYKLIRVEFGASDTCGSADVSGVIDVGCRQIPVVNGQVIKLYCVKDECYCGKISCTCGTHECGDIPEIRAKNASLIVTAVDECGNTATCTKDLCK